MKGLILKDLFTLKSFAKQYGLIFGGIMFYSIFMKTPSFLLTYAVVLGSMLVLSSMSMDENVNFNRYAMTMPVSAKEIVKAKYILLIVTTLCGIALGVLFNGIMYMTVWRDMAASEDGLAGIGMLAIITACVLADAFTLPIMFKWGAEKARYVYIIVLLGITFAIVGATKLIEILDIPVCSVESIPAVWVVTVLIGVCVLSIVLSYQAARKAAKKKEW